MLLEKFSKLGFDTSLFRMHSLQVGGATVAANAGMEDKTAEHGYVGIPLRDTCYIKAKQNYCKC